MHNSSGIQQASIVAVKLKSVYCWAVTESAANRVHLLKPVTLHPDVESAFQQKISLRLARTKQTIDHT